MKYILFILFLTQTWTAVQAQTDGWVHKSRKYTGGLQQDGYVMQGHDFFVNKAVAPVIVCEGEDAVLTVDYDGTFAYRYEWYRYGTNDPLAKNDTLVIKEVTTADRGKYYCTVIDIRTGEAKCSDTVELKIKKKPTALIVPDTYKLICWGDTITLNASSSEGDIESGDTYSYFWSGSSIVGPSNLPVVSVGPRNSGKYVVTVDNEGCKATAEVWVEVYRPVVDLPDYVYISEGNTLELGVSVPSGSQLIWTAEGNVFTEIDTFRYPNIRNSMDVTVKMINEGCEAEDKCKVYVKRGRGYKGGIQDGYVMGCIEPSIVSQDRSVASCESDTAELNVVAEGSTLKYNWQKYNTSTKVFEDFVPPAGSQVEGLGTHKLKFTPLTLEDNGMYVCKLQNDCGEVQTDTFYLSVGGVPVFQSRLNKEWGKCANTQDSTFLNVSVVDPLGGDLKYAWYKVDTLQHPTRYQLLADTSVYNKPYLKFLLNEKSKEGIYLVSASNACGDARDSVFVPVNTPIRITHLNVGEGNTITACSGQGAEFSIETEGGGNVHYYLKKITKLYQPIPLQYEAKFVAGGSPKLILNNLTKADEGWYVWEVSNECGNDTSDIINLRIDEPPVVTTLTDSPVRLCEGESTTLKCEASSLFTNVTYEWYKNGVATGKKGTTFTINQAREADAGNYTCWVTNACPVVESDIIKVEVKKYPVVLIQPYVRSSYCQGDTIEMNVKVSSEVAVDSMRWFAGNKPVLDVPGRVWGSTTELLHIDSIIEADAGNYKLVVYNSCGATSSATGTLKVDLPARFVKDMKGYTDLVLCAGENKALSVSATGTKPIRYRWTHNRNVVVDGFESTIQLNDVTVDTSGMYCCEVQNRCDGDITCAEIRVTHPDTFRFELNSASSAICASDPEGVTAVLKGSDTTTTYRLYKQPGQLVTSVYGGDIRPKGGFIEFVNLRGGTYYVEAEQNGCTYRMPGEVTVQENPNPVKFDVFISRHFCKGLHQAQVSLSGSEQNLMMEYYLQKLNGTEWVPYLDKIRGSGDTLTWDNIPEGSYKVVALNRETGCQADMTGIVEVLERDLPSVYELDALDRDSIYCANALPDVTLLLSGSEMLTKYTLLKSDGTVYRKGGAAVSWAQVEAGVYYVQAENQWGCIQQMGRQEVILQQPPHQTSITGGFVYCKEQKDSATIDILATQPGISYKVYRESPRELYADTMGTGSNIVLRVPMEEKQYYVLAQDTTGERCSIYLADTAVFRMSRLMVKGNPGEIYIGNGTSTQIHTVVTGAEGKVTYSWVPAEKLVDGEDTVAHPHTVTLTERVDYRVQVKDQSGCMADTLISVIMNDGKLSIDIRKPDKVTSIDTLPVCAGEEIRLYAWVNGGAGANSYQYTWWDEGQNPVAEQQLLTGYTRTVSGWLHLDVKSGDITEHDSVWVKVYDNPHLFGIQDTGLVCVQAGSSYQIELTGGEPGMEYTLVYSSDGTSFTDIATVQHTTASRVIFSLSDAYHQEGYYRVRAKYAHDVISCWIWMEGQVNIRKAPEIFRISEDREYCEGERMPDTVWCSGSENGVNYLLQRLGGNTVATLVGTGDSLLFRGNYGTGDYQVVAVKGMCRLVMEDTVKIIRHALPAVVDLLDKGGFCDGTCPEKIRIATATGGVDYILRRIRAGATENLETISGLGTLAFGTYCDPGEYYVVAQDQLTGCEQEGRGRLRLSGALVEADVTAEAYFCDSESGYQGVLKIGNPQDGVEYKLYTQGGNLAGVFDSVATDGLYLRENLAAGDYEVMAVNGSCSLTLTQTVSIRKLTLPQTNVLVPEYTLCEGDGLLPMAVVSTQGFHYELVKDSAGVVTYLIEKVSSAEGEQLSLGSYGSIGTYYVEVRDTVNGCKWRIPENYRIYEGLSEFGITGDTLYCAVDGGVVIGIDGTENNVKYVLEKKGEGGEYAKVDELTGKGMAVAFKGYFPAGEYRVKAVRGCEKVMNGILRVNVKAMPSDSTELVLVGNGCADSTVIIRLENTETNVNYTLWHDNVCILDTLAGNGAALEWNISPAALGNYQVAADKEGCITRLPENVEIGERPFVTEVQGDTLLCANETGELHMESWDSEAVYTLYREDGTKVSVGAAVAGKMTFAEVPVGTFYAEAARGNCVVKGDVYTIDSIPVPHLNADFWEISECVARGEGFIHILEMADSLRYVLKNSSGDVLMNYKGHKPDSLFEHLNSDQYCLVAENEQNNCLSDPLCAEIREGVTPDSLTGDFAYCGEESGATLRLSGSEMSMLYSMNTADGIVIEEITFPVKEFRKKYKAGTYVFRKERTGFMGGCYETDTIEIKHYEYASDTFRLEVRTADVTLCAEQDYLLDLYQTDAGFHYILVKDPGTAAQVYLDTVAGGPSPATFGYKIREAGYYRVYEEINSGECGRYGDTILKINVAPRPVVVQGCSYCIGEGESITSDSCSVRISGLTSGVRYFYNRDTVFGPGAKTLSPASAGEYLVMAEDLYTGCKDTVGIAKIEVNKGPKLYTVGTVCDTAGNIKLVDGSERDSVEYYLYKEGIAIAGPLRDTTGAGIDFGSYNQVGVYKIKAVNRYGCEAWMRDSATIFEDISDGILTAEGRYCQNGSEGVTIKYTKSSRGWKYYLTKGPWVSDTLSGTGGELVWNKINGNQILSQGNYDLYAVNACGDRFIDRVSVVSNPLATVFNLKGGDEAVCEGSDIPIILSQSENGVTYHLMYVKGGAEQELKVVAGTGYEVDFGNYSAYGQYVVYGDVDSSGCRRKMGEKTFYPGAMPEDRLVKGNDICLGVDAPAEVAVSIDGNAQNGVHYILQYSGTAGIMDVDTITGSMVFTVQSDTGCYQVVAEDISSGCRKELNGLYCIGMPPQTPVIADLPVDTVVLCKGEEHCISIDTSEMGVKYRLLKDNGMYGNAVAGMNWRIEVGCAQESGVYRVEAYIGDGHCRAVSADSVVLKVNDLPGLLLGTREYEYCELGTGVQIKVDYPTYLTDVYRLYSPDRTLLDTMQGNADHSALTFAGTYTAAGYYYLEVSGPTACVRYDSVKVIVHKLPEPFDLNTSNGKYLCVEGTVDMFLDSSELNVEYFLYRERSGLPDTLVGRKYGTGAQLTIAQVDQPGIYKAVGVNINTGCRNNMLQNFELLPADTVRVYLLKGLTTGYCYTDDRKGSLQLLHSQPGVSYELYRDGEPMNMAQMGTGGELFWLGLDGKPCSNQPGVEDKGYMYEVKGTDTLTKCEKWMSGQIGIVEESDPSIEAYHPNYDILRCEDQNVYFSVTAVGCRLNYTWQQNGVTVKDTAENFYNIDHIAASDYGTYVCIVTNSCGSASTPGVMLKVRDTLEMMEPMGDLAVCGDVGQDVILTAHILNGTSHEWYKIVDGVPQMLYDDSWYKLTNVTQADTGIYVYRTWNECGEMMDTCEIYVDKDPVVGDVVFRTDTVCRGSVYTLTVNSPDSVKWYRNNEFTGVEGNVFHLDSVGLPDEGRYTVRVKNACGTKALDVAQLYVDDTIRVTAVRPSEVVCENAMIDLYIMTTPTKRVEYTWEKAGVILTNGVNTNTLHVGPMSLSEPEYTYFVRYKNKCNQGERTIQLHVSNKLEYTDPESMIVCAEAGRDTFIYIQHPATMMAAYQWYYHELKTGAGAQKLEGEVSDTLWLPMKTSATGFYYCEITEVCNPVTTNSSWYRVDSIPVLLNNLSSDTLCEGNNLELSLSATGGDVHYDWTICYKDGTVEEHSSVQADFESTDTRLLSPLTMAYDSCRIWCHIYNHCAPDGFYTDTMLLRVDKRRSLVVEPAGELNLCGGDTLDVKVRLVDGALPWKFKYTDPAGNEKEVAGISDTVYTWRLWSTGTYTITRLEDTVGCVFTEGLPAVKVVSPDAASLNFTGGGEICEGDTVSLNLQVEGGTGPWSVQIAKRSGGLATEIVENGYPLVFHGRDTVLYFVPENSESYYIYKSVVDSGTTCHGTVSPADVVVNVHKRVHIDFTAGWQSSVGQCKDINLREHFLPKIEGVLTDSGMFYVNGESLNGDQWLRPDLRVGSYDVVCQYRDSFNCLVTSDVVRLTVDSLPNGQMISPDYACEQASYFYQLQLAPVGKIDSVSLRFARYREWDAVLNPIVHPDYYTQGYNKSAFSVNGLLGVPLGWNTDDSCIVVEVLGIWDVHGCEMQTEPLALYDQLYRDTIWRRWDPEVEIRTRRSGETVWQENPVKVSLVPGDSVAVEVRLVRGMPSWSLLDLGISHISGRDTLLWLKDAGTYSFRSQDDMCQHFRTTWPELKVVLQDTGYFCGRLWLEGPFDPDNGRMYSTIGANLGLPSAATLTRLPAGVSVIDWLAVELRIGSNADSVALLADTNCIVASDSCLLLTDGRLADRWTGDTIVGIRLACDGGFNNRYVVIRHRNHLGIMSRSTVHFVRKDDLVHLDCIDYTVEGNVYAKDGKLKNHMSFLSSFGWLLSGGELNTNYLITLFDPNLITLDDIDAVTSGSIHYDLMHDINFDGQVDWPGWGNSGTADWDIVKRNRQKFTEIRWK